MKFYDCIRLCLKNKKLSESTKKEYRKDLNQLEKHLKVKYGNAFEINQVLTEDLVNYLNMLITEKGYKISSRNRQMNTIRTFFKFCRLSEIIDNNPAEFLARLDDENVERVFLTPTEVNTLVSAIDHPLIRLVTITLFYTGTRITECLSLEMNDIDLANNIVYIRKGKGNKPRKLPMHPELGLALKEYINSWRVNSKTNKLFLTERSGSLSDVYVNRVLKETVKRLKWDKKVTCHVLRHSFASALVDSSANIVAVKELLGHASLKTTSGYTHIQRESAEEAIRKLAL